MASIEGCQPEIQSVPASAATSPHWAGGSLYSTLRLLVFIAIFTLGVVIIGVPVPKWALYSFAAIVGSVLFIKSFHDSEWLLAIALLYIPLSKQFVVPIAPGINGTNIILLMLMLSWVSISLREERPLFRRMANTRLVAIWGLLSCSSIVTVSLTPGGMKYLPEDFYFNFKSWIDQFILFFTFIGLIRDGAMARRVILYMMLGTLVTTLIGVQEMFNKLGLTSIEKSRLLGPQQQPNDFGAFLVYSAGPFVGLLLISVSNWRSWVLMPYLALTTKLLIMTFSRGAYLGFAAACTAAAYIRGKWFFIFATVLLISSIIVFPQLIPQSVLDRMSHTQSGSIDSVNQLDKSAESRLILWSAAIDMSLENPFFGKGFGMFPVLKSRYTERSVVESDTHNMYLYISSQMGLPAMITYLLILYATYRGGVMVFRGSEDRFGKAIGLGGVALASGAVIVNLFGSRMVNTEVSGYFWIYLAVLAHLLMEKESIAKTGKDNK